MTVWHYEVQEVIARLSVVIQDVKVLSGINWLRMGFIVRLL